MTPATILNAQIDRITWHVTATAPSAVLVAPDLQGRKRNTEQTYGLRSGIDFSSSEIDRLSSSIRLGTGVDSDWLREMISKSANLIFNVTLRPRLPDFSQ